MLRIGTILFSLLLVATASSAAGPKKIIVDVDTGVDDYEALVVLLNAEVRREIDIVAIICSDGNTELEHVKRNTVRLLEVVGRTEIPIYAGSFKPILPRENIEHFFGIDGFGDLALKENLNMSIFREELAPAAINKIVKNYPKEITYIALGPTTNLAFAFRMYEGVAENLKEILIMGGNYNDESVEFNFLGDPESANIVLSEAKTPVTLLPFQTCLSPSLNFGWRFSLNISNYVWELNDRAERAVFGNSHPDEDYVRCDILLAEAFVRPEVVIKTTVEEPLKVGLCFYERAIVFVDPDEGAKVTIIDSINVESYKLLYEREFLEICENYKCRSVEI